MSRPPLKPGPRPLDNRDARKVDRLEIDGRTDGRAGFLDELRALEAGADAHVSTMLPAAPAPSGPIGRTHPAPQTTDSDKAIAKALKELEQVIQRKPNTDSDKAIAKALKELEQAIQRKPNTDSDKAIAKALKATETNNNQVNNNANVYLDDDDHPADATALIDAIHMSLEAYAAHRDEPRSSKVDELRALGRERLRELALSFHRAIAASYESERERQAMMDCIANLERCTTMRATDASLLEAGAQVIAEHRRLVEQEEAAVKVKMLGDDDDDPNDAGAIVWPKASANNPLRSISVEDFKQIAASLYKDLSKMIEAEEIDAATALSLQDEELRQALAEKGGFDLAKCAKSLGVPEEAILNYARVLSVVQALADGYSSDKLEATAEELGIQIVDLDMVVAKWQSAVEAYGEQPAVVEFSNPSDKPVSREGATGKHGRSIEAFFGGNGLFGKRGVDAQRLRLKQIEEQHKYDQANQDSRIADADSKPRGPGAGG